MPQGPFAVSDYAHTNTHTLSGRNHSFARDYDHTTVVLTNEAGDRIELMYAPTRTILRALNVGSPVLTYGEAVAMGSRTYLELEQTTGSVNGRPPECLYFVSNWLMYNIECPNCGNHGYDRQEHLDSVHCTFCCYHRRCRCGTWIQIDDGSECSTCGYCSNGCCACGEFNCGCIGLFSCDCGNCNRHCRCQRPVFVESPIEPCFHSGDATEANPSTRYVAAEIELSSAEDYRAIADTVREWGGAIVHDGSLPSGGIEINTAPASGDALLRELDAMNRTINDANAKANDNCGVHVHIDARDFDYGDLRKLVLIYEKIEDTLFSMVPEDRRSNSYCQMVGSKFSNVENYHSARDIKMALVGSVYNIKVDMRESDTTRRRTSIYDNYSYNEAAVDHHIEEMKHDKYHGARYAALNLHSWFYRGTVECRLHHGTTNIEDVKQWAIMWAAILDYAKNTASSAIEEMPAGKESLLSMVTSENTRSFIERRVTEFASSYSRW